MSKIVAKGEKMRKNLLKKITIGLTIIAAVGCTKKEEASAPAAGQPAAEASGSDKGVGPVTEVKLAALDGALADKGKDLFTTKCAACHKIEEKYVGPALKDVTKRRKPEWIMNMMLNSTEMVQKDPIAKGLLEEFLTPMPIQNLSQEDARSILEFFRRNDGQ